MTHWGAQPAKVHTQFKREPINAGLTFMVIYSCLCACFCPPTSTLSGAWEEQGGGGEMEVVQGGWVFREWGVVWTQEVQRGGWVHCEDTTSLIMPSQSALLLTGSPCKAHLPWLIYRQPCACAWARYPPLHYSQIQSVARDQPKPIKVNNSQKWQA